MYVFWKERKFVVGSAVHARCGGDLGILDGSGGFRIPYVHDIVDVIAECDE
jgi:hypothetical protein